MRPRVVLVVWLAALLGAALLVLPTTRAALANAGTHARTAAGLPAAESELHTAAQAAPPVPTLRVPDGGVTIPSGYSLAGWAMIDRASGKVVGGSDNADQMTNYTESMIKPWIAADYLSRTVKAGRKPSQYDLSQLRLMIIHSDDNIASHYYNLGGKDSVIRRLNQVCGVHTTIAMSGWWSYTSITPDDAARYGECLANGTAAGPYTANLLSWMRQVVGGVNDQPHGAGAHTGGGHWGIITALPASLAAQTSIKNGWEPEVSGHEWHVNCLAITPGQVLTVMFRYPWTSPTGTWQYADNLAPGAAACQKIAAQLVYSPQI